MESMMMMAAAIFLLLVLADFSLADTPQDRISGRMYVRFLSGWQTVCAAFSKKGTLEKFDNPAICLSDQEAKRLLKFLAYFLPCQADNVPINSIMREFIGGGCFRV